MTAILNMALVWDEARQKGMLLLIQWGGKAIQLLTMREFVLDIGQIKNC